MQRLSPQSQHQRRGLRRSLARRCQAARAAHPARRIELDRAPHKARAPCAGVRLLLLPQQLSCSAVYEVQLDAGCANNTHKFVFGQAGIIIDPVLNLHFGCRTGEEQSDHAFPLRQAPWGACERRCTGTASQVLQYVSTLWSCDEVALDLPQVGVVVISGGRQERRVRHHSVLVGRVLIPILGTPAPLEVLLSGIASALMLPPRKCRVVRAAEQK